jgi:sigma-E factor negative regulatory protein RseB
VLFRLLLTFFLPAFCAVADSIDSSPQQWLEKMSHAMKTLEYQGTIVFAKNGRLDTMKYFHTINHGLQQERLLSLNSPMREVIREAGKVRCIFKKSNKIVVNHRPVSKSFIVDLPIDFSNLKDIYHYSMKGDESVAMLPARIISIEAKDKFRYGRTIWIDKKHFLPLKVEVYNLSGETLEQVVFTELLVGNKLDFVHPDSKIKKPQVLNIYQQQSSPPEKADFILEKIPPGFKTVFFTKIDSENSTQPVEHLLLSDGFSSISIYRESKSANIQQGLQTLGVVNSFTHNINNFQITVMGEVPANSVQLIAQGVKFR